MAEGLLTMSIAELERSHVVLQADEDRLSAPHPHRDQAHGRV